MILCECGDIIGNDKFKDYIKTSRNPSTATIGHCKCGFIFNFIDSDSIKKYSSKIDLKVLAREFADKKQMTLSETEKFLLTIDRLKRNGNLSDYMILTKSYHEVFGEHE